MTQSGIEPATSRLVAQCLNQHRQPEHLVLALYILHIARTANLCVYFDTYYSSAVTSLNSINTISFVFTARYGLGCYRGADTSLARPGRKQTNVSVRMT